MKKEKLFLLALASSLLFSCGEEKTSSNENSDDSLTQVDSIELNSSKITLRIGQTFLLTSSKKGVAYSSNNENVASVDKDGLILARTNGNAIIKVSLGDIFALAEVIVTDEAEETLSIEFSTTDIALYEGESLTLSPIVKYGNKVLKDIEIVYGSEDENVASFLSSKIEAKSFGNTRVYATSTYEGISSTCYVNVEVLKIETQIVPSFKQRELVVNEEGIELSFKIMKGSSTLSDDASFEYKISDTSVAAVESGILIGKKKGDFDLTVFASYNDEKIENTYSFVVKERIEVNFYSEGSIYKTFSLLNGEKLDVEIEDPILPGYLFNGFSDEFNNPFEYGKVFEETTPYYANYLALVGKDESSKEEKVKSFDSIDGFAYESLPGFGFNFYSDNIGDSRLVEGGYKFNLQVSGKSAYQISLPKFDFNKAGRVDFDLVDNYGNNSYSFYGVDAKNNKSDGTINSLYVVSKGSKSSLYMNGSFVTELDEETSNGKKGLTFTFTKSGDNPYQSIWGSPFTRYTLDYKALIASLLDSLPSEVKKGEEKDALLKLDNYLNSLSYLTPYEKESYVEPIKVTNLKKSLSGQQVDVLSLPTSLSSWADLNSIGIYTDASGFFLDGDFLRLDLQSGGVSSSNSQYVEFPKINYSLYSEVVFKFYTGGYANPNNTTASIKVNGIDFISSTSCPNSSSYSIIKIKTENGITSITSFSKDGVSNNDSINLDNEVATGKKSLHLDIVRDRVLEGPNYDRFAFSSFVGIL